MKPHFAVISSCLLATALACGTSTVDPMETGAEGSSDESADGTTGSADDTTDDTSGDGDGDGDGDGAAIEIAGDYTDEWTTMHTISDTEWTQAPDTYLIASYDNAADFAVAQNGPTNAFNPDLWSRFDWVWVGTDLYYCQTSYDSATQGDAEAAVRGDDSDPAVNGCGGMFPWTKLN